jgi:predicted methyltransferase
MTERNQSRRLDGAFVIVALCAAIGLGSAAAQPKAGGAAPDYAAIVAAPDRSDADRQTDNRREPAKLLAFTGAAPGMKVLDMGAGGGYSTELMARAVAPNGVVYGQNAADLFERAKAAFEARIKTPAGKNIVAVTRPFDDPVPADVHDLDLITFFFYYHDTTYMQVDRAQMDKKLFAALKPGGFLIVADHSAKPGEGTSVAKTNHRIEESALRSEVEAAGFKLVGTGDFLRHPEDPRDFNVNRPTGPVDNFVLKFQKPN